MPHLISQVGIGLSYGSHLPTSTVLCILPGLSRVRHVRLRQNGLGGAFLGAPSTLCGSPVTTQGNSGLPVSPFTTDVGSCVGSSVAKVLRFRLYWLTYQTRYVRGVVSRRAMRTSGDSPLPFQASCRSSAKQPVLRACLSLRPPFRSMLFTFRSGSEGLAPRAHQIPVYPMVFPHSYLPLSRRTTSTTLFQAVAFPRTVRPGCPPAPTSLSR